MKWMIWALLSAATACSANTPEPQNASASGFGAPQASFTEYQTFSLAPANPPADGYEVTQRSLEVQRRLSALVRDSLQKRGYAEAADGADLLVKVSAGSGEIPGDKTMRGNPDEPTPGGFIAIDAYDRRTGATVFHGSGKAEVKPEAPIDDALLSRGVETILADFPARRGPETANN